jgi:multidrug transporter EmrE-like cation transporter
MSYLYIVLTIVLTVYGQIIIKWQVVNAGEFPEASVNKVWFLLGLLLNPWIISAFLSAFLASMSWMAVMTKLQLSYAYPFTSLTFVFVLVLSGMLFHETITLPKAIGMGLIVLGIIVGSQG